MLNCIIIKDKENGTTEIPCVFSKVEVASSNKLQLSPSLNKKDTLILRTGNWSRRITVAASFRDDMELGFEYVENKNADESVSKIPVGLSMTANTDKNNTSNFLTDLKTKLSVDNKFLENYRKQFVVELVGIDFEEESDVAGKTIDLFRTLLENFGEEHQLSLGSSSAEKNFAKKISSKKISVVVDDIHMTTDVSNNITTLSMNGSFRFYSNFKSSDFIGQVIK